ncbi:glycosyltransferase [Clostridium sp. CF012]|uniref:GumK N-terminal domain-containing glycosyltransferase n=1 Tax=Clostridium sp. CF012 TaxID=2843319 RepID=UPI001C0E700E|nr:glycosyltransferase [Clostridium sp. CF012]MBU3142585.1 glycosyltransferase [Clostridium sp. CF012]
MKKIIISDFVEYNDESSKLGNYHYANCFAKEGYEVLWMSNAFNQLVYIKDKKDYKFKKNMSKPIKHELAPNIYGYAPYSLWLYGNYMFHRNSSIVFNLHKLIRPNINKILKEIGFDEVDVLWISNPKQYWLTNVVKYNKLIYRIADDFTKFSEYPSSVAQIEERLIDTADHIFITSKLLEEKVLKRNKTPYILNNGVEFERFNKSYKCPKEYSGFRKRIVYIGAIKYWFDSKLVKKLASEVEADIYLIGKPQIDLSELGSMPNVFILGAKSYQDIPAYLQYGDVAIIPFIKNELTNAISPIKLYEYCCAGIAVVSTNMRETANLNAPIHIAENDKEFIDGVKYYLENEYDKERLIDFAKSNSWHSRYEYVKNIIT